MDEKAQKIEEYEAAMQRPDFWADKDAAQRMVREYQELKDAVVGGGKYEKGEAVLTIFSGAGGDDAEDFARMLFEMYQKFIAKQGWSLFIVHEHKNDDDGYKSVTVEINGAGAYGMLKNESGVHRLVRISPFNASKKRHTSFVMVEVVPKLEKAGMAEIPEQELRFEFARSGGAGGQNVNKRETAVRVVHIPTNLSVHASSERSQQANREKALAILRGKLYHRDEELRKKEARGLSVSATTSAEWGSQIRSYVLHPYRMVKDHRTNVETSNVEAVLGRGDLEEFIEAEKNL